MKVKTIHRGMAQCALDLGDGSERAEYVCQDYVLNKLRRPHRAVNIMYTYYPKDKEWPARISEACKDMDVSFAWDYPYDDYFPYGQNNQPFEQMRDIRRHGQDVMLTITMDCSLEDSYLEEIAEQLSNFGRMRLRINHECNGNWFTHNKRYSYKEIADFFVRFNDIIKAKAPNITTVFCAGLIGEDGKVECEDDFAKAYEAADEWSADKYLALHYGWPYDVAEKGGNSYTFENTEALFSRYKGTHERLSCLFGNKVLTSAEMNVDGDVSGPMNQSRAVLHFYDLIKQNKASWFRGVSMYQFRDRGRLGLEIEDPNNSSVGIEQPLLKDYVKIMNDPYFTPAVEITGESEWPVRMRWGGAEDADGIEMTVMLERFPVFCEATFEKELSLMIDWDGMWFYKAPGVEIVDFMPYFFGKSKLPKKEVPVRIYSTPADGCNHPNGCDDWNINYYSTMNAKPLWRIRYEEVGIVI